MPQSVTSGDKWEYARVTRLKRSGFVFQSFILVLALCADTFGAGRGDVKRKVAINPQTMGNYKKIKSITLRMEPSG